MQANKNNVILADSDMTGSVPPFAAPRVDEVKRELLTAMDLLIFDLQSRWIVIENRLHCKLVGLASNFFQSEW
jgi:hypothetical protein